MPHLPFSCQQPMRSTRNVDAPRSRFAAALAFLLLVCLLAAAGGSVASTVTDFDGAVARGLPAGLRGDLPAQGAARADATRAAAIMHVDTRMPVRLVYSDDGEAALYRGKVDGYPAIFTRYADRLDIFVNAAPHSDAYTINYATQKPNPEIRVLTQPAKSETVLRDIVLAPGETTPESPTGDRAKAKADSRDTAELIFSIFVHDDAKNVAINDHLSWWVGLIEALLPVGRTMAIDIRRDLPGVTDFAYASDDPNRKLLEWLTLVRARFPQEIDVDSKFLLFTRNPISSTTAGIAFQGGDYGIASASSHQTLAHEFGHMLDATHKHAEVRYNGWWCETIMFAAPVDLRSNCYDYSDANEKLIRSYLE
ncbi:hypothetical protein [Paraburkholderia bryophila]|uniref:Reprolysin-like metallo-peptidase family M12B n=1 Tax=Paraburkholderia bryophila TaxID=420952 RepID=A0A7Y9WUZ6_9BURK|nr:hypothetical protein [Paraburkholderia bryophila]NYH27476.1 hypothetical protein [Paraburkholderia bryophila]